jgi:uracil-DNA glycosylase
MNKILNEISIDINESWLSIFNNIHESWIPIFKKHINLIIDNIKYMEEYENANIQIYPPKEYIFKVFEMNIEDINVVLLGQDPYHGKEQANGLSFSVGKNIKIPPSLQNIYKEIKLEFPEKKYEFQHGNLERWFKDEKIFLLNTSLTVIEGKPGSFMKKWIFFTDDVIKHISENNKKCIFLLLGNYSKEKIKYIEDKERYITGVHPSPLSANRGFFGSEIFIKLNQRLGYEINWNI